MPTPVIFWLIPTCYLLRGHGTVSNLFNMGLIHRKKYRRINHPGDAHFLTFSCFQRRKFLSKDRTRQWLIDAIELARTKHKFHLWAYVIMPEHAHLLLLPSLRIYSISKILSTIKQSVSKKAIAHLRANEPKFLDQLADLDSEGNVTYRFWQRGGGFDRNLTEAEAIWAEIDYCHLNPVKRKLCVNTTDWILSSAIEYEKPGTGLLRIDRESLPRLFL
jgi:putative transposase